MINCPICSVVNDDAARFCAECGQRLQPDPAPVATQMPAKEPEIAAPPPVQAAPEIVPTQPAVTPEAISAIEEAKRPTPPKPMKKLHSPLLKPDEYEEEEEPPIHTTGKKGRALRSPILGGSEPSYEYESEQDEFASKHKGLRSPLLGGSEVEQPQHRFAAEPSHTRPGHLHSPLLDSTYDEYDDFIDDFETVEDPNVLRSPLLAAKVPMHTHSHEPKEETPAPTPAAPPPVTPPVAPPASMNPPISSPVSVPPTSSPMPVATPTPSAPSQTPSMNTPLSSPLESASRFPTAGVGQLPHPTKLGVGGPTGLRSSLLGSQEEEEYESSRYAPPPEQHQDAGMSSVIRMFVWPLALAACVRLWVMAEYAAGGMLSPPVIAGELSHIVVIAFLILVAINYPTQKRF
ncbi:MAG: zinc ribbon domain-containing protein [Candidatus Obscuribacterales bacterium]|nr:zinc ribbon domain-containing protein [Candidatus Obscuribacterales bacterium]